MLVGKTSASLSTAGVTAYGGSFNGLLASVRDGAEPLYLNRLTSDGSIASFQKDGFTVGNIGSRSSGANLYIAFRTEAAGDGCGLTGSSASTGAIIPSDGNGNAADDHIDLGANGTRTFDDIYATNGTIQTSDRNEKQDIEELSDAEQRVAVACKGLLRKFRKVEVVTTKGRGRHVRHFGIIAQVRTAFHC